jgi:hypothetical protein
VIKIHNTRQGTKKWHKLRDNRITASNAHILLEKGKQEALEANKKVFKGNYWTERGLILESEALEIYEAVKDVDVLKVGFVTNDEYPDCGASPDGIAGDTLIEIKCFNEKRHGKPDFKVLAQVHFAMMVCGLEKAHIVYYNPDLDIERGLIIHEVKQRKSIIDNIKKSLEGNDDSANNLRSGKTAGN